VPVPAAALLVALSIAVTTAALTFASGIGVLRDSPDRSGYTWDITLGSNTSDAQAALTKALRADRRVAAITRIALGTVTLGTLPGQRAFAFDDVGSIQPVMLAGRRPAGTDEIALGPETMGEAGLHIGDRVTVASTDDGGLGPKRFRIVGRAITPTALDVWEQLKPGVGALMTLDAARRLNGDIDNNLAYVVRLKKGGDLDAVAASIRDDVPGTTPVVRQQPEDLANLEQVRGIPYVLAGLVAFLGVGTLVHVLAIGVRRRRHDLAILKALGLVRSQVRAVIAWEGALIAAVGLMLGIPVGLAAGRWTWRWFAERLIVVPDPVIPWGALAAIAPAALLLAWLASQLPSRVAAHTRAASLLRAE
jgi:ABC-type lipoprotein release transport system permease subunit